MATEYEIKLLGIDEQKVQDFFAANDIKLHDTIDFKRVVFDTIPKNENAWIRLRAEQTQTTLTYKNSRSDSIDGMQEIEIVVDDFDKTKELLELAGLKPRNYQENKRKVYYAYNCMITIDYWPQIPPYIEIESTSKQNVEAALEKFAGLYESTTSQSTEEVYAAYGIDLRSIDYLTFD